MYRIQDDHGTNQTCWTWATAVQWLAAAAPHAVISNRFTGRFIAYRHQTNFNRHGA